MNIEIKKEYVIKLTNQEKEDLIIALNDTFHLVNKLSSTKQYPPNILQDFKELLDL